MIGYQEVYKIHHALVAIFIAGDVAVACSYYVLVGLMIFMRGGFRSNLARSGFTMFAILALLSGTTRVINVWNMYHDNYWFEAWMKMANGFMGILVAILGYPIVKELRK